MKVKTLIIVFFLISSLHYSQEKIEELIVPIEIDSDCGDFVGDSLIVLLKNKINDDENLILSSEGPIRIILKIITMDRLPERPNLSSIYSAIWLLKTPDEIFDTYMTSEIGITSKIHVTGTADNIISKTFDIIEGMKNSFQ